VIRKSSIRGGLPKTSSFTIFLTKKISFMAANPTELFGKELRQVTLGPWNVYSHAKTICMEKTEIDVLKNMAKYWAHIFPRERNTLALEELNVPSVLIRFDYIVNEDGVHVFEIEDRPMGLYHCASIINETLGPEIKRVFDLIRNKIDRKISVFVSPSRIHNSDDLIHQYCGTKIYDEHFSSLDEIHPHHALIVRSLREEESYWRLESKSLSTVSMEGWKGYGTRLGLWENINGEPDFNSSFVIKPEFGCRGENVYLFTPKTKSADGFSTRTKILNVIRDGKVQYIQPYHKPEKHDFLGEKYHMIRRVYFGWNPIVNEYDCLGGMWMARTSVKVHGASDAISGAIVAR
jgi:hypothetical protein